MSAVTIHAAAYEPLQAALEDPVVAMSAVTIHAAASAGRRLPRRTLSQEVAMSAVTIHAAAAVASFTTRTGPLRRNVGSDHSRCGYHGRRVAVITLVGRRNVGSDHSRCGRAQRPPFAVLRQSRNVGSDHSRCGRSPRSAFRKKNLRRPFRGGPPAATSGPLRSILEALMRSRKSWRFFILRALRGGRTGVSPGFERK